MSNKEIKILAIETSCDETAAAVIGEKDDRPMILSNIVSSQVDMHAKTGGVVPEVASRAHMEAMIPVIEEALREENLNSKLKIDNCLKDITHIAITVGPGLIGSLLVGFNTAKSLAYALNIPIIPINHIEGHIYSAFTEKFSIINNQFLNKSQINNFQKAGSYKLTPESFPILALTVSGGHTSLTLVKDHGVYENIGSTLDDAAGEAFDKVAKLLGLGYPGGPAVSKIAAAYREKMSKSYRHVIASHRPTGEARQSINESDCFVPRNDKRATISLPLPLARDNSCNFSFSGLKTAVINVWRKAEKEYKKQPEKLDEFKAELAAKFEETATAHLIDKTLKALKATGAKTVILAGGVSANKYLRENLQKELENLGITLLMPAMELTGDNAAMIGLAAYYHILRNDVADWKEIKVDSNLKL